MHPFDSDKYRPDSDNRCSGALISILCASDTDVEERTYGNMDSEQLQQALAALAQTKQTQLQTLLTTNRAKQWHKVIRCSVFAREQLYKAPSLLLSLLPDMDKHWDIHHYQASLIHFLKGDEQPFSVDAINKTAHEIPSEVSSEIISEAQLDHALRCWRNAMMVRLIWRDLNRLDDTLGITQELTHLADCAVEQALEFHYQALTKTKGTPCNDEGQPQTFFVIGMGKLGAYELNLSSDIDLIFAYPDRGATQFPEPSTQQQSISNQEFFTLLGQKLIKSLDNPTVDGFVFRVDMRLRPYGQSGALVSSFSALETYYITQGREWERYAMVKARIVASALPNQKSATAELAAMLNNFTYRRYVDFSAIGALRDLKIKIRQEVKRRKLSKNVKLGEGGIREVEFIAQSLQLIRGGLDTQLQTPSLKTVLRLLAELEILPKETAKQLFEHYCFLRNVEHAIQAWQDKQTQDLPIDPPAQAALTLALDFSDWMQFNQALDDSMAFISEQFSHVIAEPEHQDASSGSESWQAVWLADHPESAQQLLETKRQAAKADAQGSKNHAAQAESIAQTLHHLHNASQIKAADTISRQRLDAFMPLLLASLQSNPQADQILLRLEPFIIAVVRRSAYLLLLIESPAALKQLILLSEASPWIPEQLTEHPALLDELLHPTSLYLTPNKADLATELQQTLLRIPEEDLEQQMESLRYFKQAHALRIAACEVTGVLPLMKVSDYLSWLAEVILEYATHIAWQEMITQYGLPGGQDSHTPNFIIVGYGKLGGLELSHSSDLDLVFIHDANPQADTQANAGQRTIDNHTFYTRMSQKIIHVLSVNTPSGMVYEIDMRLRPSGNSGMLVSTLSAFEKYQQNTAWTWEHQALVRARVITGHTPLASKFSAVRQAILSTPRDTQPLQKDVVEMRAKMRHHLGTKKKEKASQQFHLKQDAGGIVDIEFIVQYLVLAYAHQHSDLTRYTDNIRILDIIQTHHLLDEQSIHVLVEGYKALRSYSHRLALQKQSNTISINDYKDVLTHKHNIENLWHSIFTSPA